ncbi:hypothetical protein E2C01_034798 [Portunus trituberculatus]|uniref:Cell growth regulator with RING finger domain protein 1 n=1 Tax=Portunus trituberculatus TaxID=210409 RepID=A0A5B7F1H9_PORTR|nr:hypothetical protein [Portunus trituberculatus]
MWIVGILEEWIAAMGVFVYVVVVELPAAHLWCHQHARVQGDMFGTSVVHVAQPPIAQMAYQKVEVPFSMGLHMAQDASFSGRSHHTLIKRTTRALLPCRHVCVCDSCCSRLDNCPMCRTRILAYFLVAPEDSTSPRQDHPGGGDEMDPPSAWHRFSGTVNRMMGIENNQ